MILSLEKFTVSAPTRIPKERKRKPATDVARADREVEPRLLDLVRLRVLQIHGCKENIREQATKLKAHGETGRHLHLLSDWRNQTIFSDHEEAALNLAEALTHNPMDSVPDEVVHATGLFFNEAETLRLILAILAANDWCYLNASSTGRKTCRLFCE